MLAEESRPDVVILGYSMPIINGLDTARTVQLSTEDGLALSAWIRSNPPISHVPIIAVTANGMDGRPAAHRPGSLQCLRTQAD